MASPAYEQILQVQSVDLTLTRLRHQHANHPARRPVVEAEKAVADVDRELVAIDARHHDLDRARRKLEDEAAILADKRAAINDKLYGGAVTASKELLALQDEAAMLKARQDGVEDRELELMEQLENMDHERQQGRQRRHESDAERTRLQAVLDEALSALDTEIEAVGADRARQAAAAEPALLARYESLRGQFDGVAVARLVNGACDGCHIQLSAVAVDRLAKMPDDAVVNCEECGRLLVH